MKIFRNCFIFLFASVFLFACQDSTKRASHEPGQIEFKVHPFELRDVTLLDGPFKHANDLNVKVLLNYEPDRFLATFRHEAGLEPRAQRYGGWESSSIAGHTLGHYLSGCAMMYQSTGMDEFLERVNYMVEELWLVQQANGGGYIGAFPKGQEVFENEIADGVIRASIFDLNGIWAPWYTHHKVLAGLRDAYTICGNEKALEVAVAFANWMDGIVGHLSQEVIQEMLVCEFGGMPEVLADIYGFTGEKRFLDLARDFNDKSLLDSLSIGVDILPGMHANTQIPKIIGLSRQYELTGNDIDKNTSMFFWDRVVNYHSYVTGGNALNEFFGPAGKLRDRLGRNTGETCNVYNMLKLTDHLFRWEPSPELADYYERALFNHILASQHPENGRVTYHLTVDQGAAKYFQDPNAFTCCIGTGMENHAKYNENIYYHNENELFVSQYIASELNWNAKGVVLRQETNYPQEQGTKFLFDCDEPVAFTLQLRYPSWAELGMEIVVNGEKQDISALPGNFVAVHKTWETGDLVEVKMPFTLRMETMPDDQNRIALMHGPLVLAGDLGPEEDPKAYDLIYVPLLVTDDRDPNNWTQHDLENCNAFTTKNVGNPHDLKLKPFYATYDRRFSIYWDIAKESEWKELEARHLALMQEKKILEERTIDFFQPGDISHERSHFFEGPQSTAHGFRDRTYRVTLANGSLKFKLKVLPNQAVALNLEYWGGGYRREKSFDILVEGIQIASEDITLARGDKFFNVEYDIPTELTLGKKEVTIEINAQARRIAGPLYGARTVIK